MATAFQLGMTGSIGAARARATDMSGWHARIQSATHAHNRSIALCLAVGLALNAITFGAFFGTAVIGPHLLHQPAAPELGAAIGIAACALMLLLAPRVKPQGRAELTSNLLRDGFRAGCRQRNGAAGLAVMMIMMVALYGSFAIVEAARRIYARWKVSTADHYEMARVLAQIASNPLGVPVSSLLKQGQSLHSLRLPIAALLLDGWVTLQDGGRTLQQCAPHDLVHAWKHPLAEIFQYVAPPTD